MFNLRATPSSPSSQSVNLNNILPKFIIGFGEDKTQRSSDDLKGVVGA